MTNSHGVSFREPSEVQPQPESALVSPGPLELLSPDESPIGPALVSAPTVSPPSPLPDPEVSPPSEPLDVPDSVLPPVDDVSPPPEDSEESLPSPALLSELDSAPSI